MCLNRKFWSQWGLNCGWKTPIITRTKTFFHANAVVSWAGVQTWPQPTGRGDTQRFDSASAAPFLFPYRSLLRIFVSLLFLYYTCLIGLYRLCLCLFVYAGFSSVFYHKNKTKQLIGLGLCLNRCIGVS